MAGTLDALFPGHIQLESKLYKLKTEPIRRKITQWAPPIRTGNAEFSDDQIASSVIWDDLTGGMGVINMDERNLPDRFTDADAWTMTKKLWTLPPKPNQVTNGPNSGSPDTYMVSHNQHVYMFNGANFIRISIDNGAPSAYWLVSGEWMNTGSFASRTFVDPLSSNPIVWKDDIYYTAHGGLWRYKNNTSAVQVVTSGGAQFSAEKVFAFDDSLAVIQTDGTIKSFNSIDAAGAVSLVTRGQLTEMSMINGIEIGRNLSGDPAPIIATDKGLFIHDWFAAKIYPMGVQFKDNNPLAGRGLTQFDGDLWFGKGGNANQLVNGARITRGPNAGDGVVTDRQGNMVDLGPFYENYLLGVYSGASNMDSPANKSSIFAYNRRGWHSLYVTPASTITTHIDDDFNRADSTNTPGGSWTSNAGTWGIIGNRVYKSAGSGATRNNLTRDIALSTGFAIQARFVRQPTSSVSGLLVQYTDTNNYALVSAGIGAAYDIEYRSGGVSTITALATYPTAKDGDVVKVIVLNTQISVYVNGAYIGGVSTSLTGTKVGFYTDTSACTTPRWDDFKAYSLPYSISKVGYLPSGDTTKPSFVVFHQLNSDGFYYIKLYDLTDNPEQYPTGDYDTTGYVTLPKFDANLANVQKTALNVQLRVRDATATEVVTVYYRTDDSSSWVQMFNAAGSATTITSAGLHTLYFDNVRKGTLYFDMQFKVEMTSDNVTESPKIVFLKMRYLRELDVLYGWDFVLDLDGMQPGGRMPLEAITDLDALVDAKKLVDFSFQEGVSDDDKLVLILQYSGPTGEGTRRGGTARISVVEVQ